MFILCVKSSHAMGMGHLFRAINIYRALQCENAEAMIVLLEEHAASMAWLDKEGVPYTVVKDGADRSSNWEARLISRYGAKVWVNDRMQTDGEHAARIKALGLKLVTFDDTGPGAGMSDLHVAPLAALRRESPAGARVLVGIEYLLLSPEVARYRRQRKEASRWVISLGGSDTHGVTVKIAKWLGDNGMRATIILGPAFAHDDALASIDCRMFDIKRSVPSLAEEFYSHDIAITGGGLTAFEAAAAGLPTIVVANEPWEILHGQYLESLGCSRFAGPCEAMNLEVLHAPLDIESMSHAALSAVNAEGVKKVSQELLAMIR